MTSSPLVWVERSLAAVWSAARGGNLRTEACLEAALAAALEAPQVFSRLAAHVGWTAPEGHPTISTQDTVTSGRSDIRLTWEVNAKQYQLVLELKVDAPPDRAQIEKYLDAGADVVAVARFARPLSIGTSTGGRFLGTVTWRQIRSLRWQDGPVPVALAQLFQLIDVTEVAVSLVTLPGLTGFVASWHAWTALREWANHAAEVIVADLASTPFACVQREGKKGRLSFDDRDNRYGALIWPPPWRGDLLQIVLGTYAGRPGDPTIVDGVPDLLLTLIVDPKSHFSKQLETNGACVTAIAKWRGRDQLPAGGLREFRPGSWEIVRARATALPLVQEQDQEGWFKTWIRTRIEEWRGDGVLDALGALEKATRSGAGPAPAEDPSASE